VKPAGGCHRQRAGLFVPPLREGTPDIVLVLGRLRNPNREGVYRLSRIRAATSVPAYARRCLREKRPRTDFSATDWRAPDTGTGNACVFCRSRSLIPSFCSIAENPCFRGHHSLSRRIRATALMAANTAHQGDGSKGAVSAGPPVRQAMSRARRCGPHGPGRSCMPHRAYRKSPPSEWKTRPAPPTPGVP
jgi:hypothetical protein